MRDFERLEEWHKKRYLVLPGITGLWQVSGRSELDFDDLVRLDFLYLERWSVFARPDDPAQDHPRGAHPARRVLATPPRASVIVPFIGTAEELADVAARFGAAAAGHEVLIAYNAPAALAARAPAGVVLLVGRAARLARGGPQRRCGARGR